MDVNYQQNRNLLYFYNFEIVDSNLYDYLFLMLELNINTSSVENETLKAL